MARTVNFLPEIFRTPTNEKILRATLDQLVQEPTYKRAEGFIGRRYGPGQTVNDKYIVEEDKTRRDYQLEPATIFLEQGSKRVVDALTYPGYLDALAQQLSPTQRPDLLFEEEYYVWDPFVDYDKFVNYNQYYWIYQGPDVIRLTAPTSAIPFDPGTAIVGMQTYDTSEGTLIAPSTWAPNTVKFTNGLKVLFTGNITAGYKDIEYYVEGVGTEEGIKLLPVENFAIPEIYNYPIVFKREDIPWDQFPWDTTLWDGSRLVPGSDIDYITINRASRDLNAWTRANRWFHIDVLQYTASILGKTLSVDDNARGRRPILEFRPNLQLFNSGVTGLDPISVIDYSSTNPFLQVAGQQSYTIDGIDIFAGMQVIFAAAEDPAVATQVYLVEQITPVLGQPPVFYLSAIAGQVAVNGSLTVCKLGLTQQGKSFYYRNGSWIPAQQKTAPNQAPLFDLYDVNGISFSDAAVYPATTFAGSKLFSYTPGTGVADTILRFPIRYRNVGNIGDILFDYNLYKDSFTYESNLTVIKQSTSAGFVHYNNTSTSFEKLTGYQTATLQPNQPNPTALLSQQPQVFEFDYTGGSLTLDIAVLEQSAYPDITNITQIYVNDTLIDPSLYTVVLEDAQNRQVYPTPVAGAGPAIKTVITFEEEPAENSLIVCFALSEQVSATAYYQIPTNLSKNALNADVTEITLGTVRDHYVTICQNINDFQGVPLSSNNTRDLGNIIPYGINLIQHSAALPIPAVMLRDPRYNFWGALTFNAKQYQKYKDQLLDFVWKNEFVNETTANILNSAIDGLKINRSDDSPFYWSSAITAGVHETNSYTWIDGSSTVFDLINTYDYSKPNYAGINVYINNNIICKDRDYEVDTVLNTIDIKPALLSDGDVVTIDEYSQTYGNFVPATPSSLRLYPAYYPEIYVDTTYSTPTTVIRGHDGSITPAFGDYRDAVLLEFETRIYSNIKGPAVFPLDYHDFLPGAFRTSEYNKNTVVDIQTLDFVNWLGSNKIDYKQQDFNINNEFSWNYSQSSDKLDGAVLPGYWRQVYLYYYDTDEPQNTPWEMLGFSNKPIWWEETYGSAPYTSQNLVLWQDLATGTIREPGAVRVDTTYARPGLLDVIPVDAQGNLISPFVSLVAGYNPSTWNSNWSLTSGSPAQSAFDKSSYYPFAILGLLASLKPAQFFSYYIDRTLYKYDQDLNQWLYDNRYRLVAANVEVYGAGLAKNSYLNFIVEYLKSYGLEGTKQLEEKFENLDIRLNYRVAGFTDKRYLALLSDRGSPQSSNKSLLIPDENYDVILYRNQIFNNINFSAVTVERTENGFAVYGNSLSAPYFKIVPAIINNNFVSVDIGPTNIRFYKDFADETVLIPYGYTFLNINAVVNFISGYGEYLQRQGFINKTVENTVLLNWTQMAQEVVYWYNQGWSPGSLIQVNPSANVIEFEKPQTVVTNLLENRREDALTNQNRLALSPRDYTIDRIANNFKITSLNENNLGFLNIKLTNYEHMLVLDNVTDFNDLIYDQFTGLRQSRLLYNGIKSGDWNGTLDAPGFIINLPNIVDWDDNQSYSKGEVVRFKNFYYQANETVDPSTEFNYNQWTQIRYRPDQEGMLPNLALKAKQSTQYYNQHSADLNEDANLLGYGITGFRPYDWMASIELDTQSQINGYLEFVRRKGTPGVIDYYNNAQVSDDTLTYSYYENWALQRATYGATATNAYIQLELDASKLLSNPATVALTELGQTSDADQKIPVTSIYDSSFLVTRSNVLPTISGYLPDQGLPSAGYVQSDDVEIQLFSIDDTASINAQLTNINQDTEIWVAKNTAVDWMVYKCQSIGVTLAAVSDNLNGQAIFLFDGDHNLTVNEKIIVKEFDSAVNGAYTVVSVSSNNSVLVDFTMPPGTQILLGNGIVFRLLPVRVAQPSDIADLEIEMQLRANNKVWIDNNSFDRWSVINKQLVYGGVQSDNQGNTNGRFGSSISVTADDEHILVGAPGLYTNGAVIPYYNDAGNYTAQNPITIPSFWSTAPGRTYKNLGERADAAGDEWSAFSITWGPTANISTYANVALFEQAGNTFAMRWMFGAGTANKNFTGQIKFSEDRNWLYVSNPDARLVSAYQRVPYQKQEIKFEANGSDILYPVGDKVRVSNGAQFSVTINRTVQTWLQDYNAIPAAVRFTFPPPAPVVLEELSYAVNTATVVVNSIEGLAVGQRVTGLGLDAETYVQAITTSIVDNNFIYTLTLDKNFTVSASNATLTFINQIYISRWDTNPASSYWAGGLDPTVARGGRVFPFNFLAGATGFAESVGVYLNNQFMRAGEDYNFNFNSKTIEFRNFTPSIGSKVTFIARDFWLPVGTMAGGANSNSWGTALATNGDGTVIAIGEPKYDTVDNNNDGRFVVYNRGSIDHKVSNVQTSVYTTPVPIQGLPQVYVNNRPLIEDTDINFGEYVYEPDDANSAVYTGNAAIRLNPSVVANINIGDIVTITYNSFDFLQSVTNPIANLTQSEFGYSLSMDRGGTAITAGAPNGNVASVASGFAARIVDRAQLYGEITGVVSNPTVSIGSSLRINNFLVEFDSSNIANIANTLPISVSTGQVQHGFYDGETVTIAGAVSFGQTNFGNGSINNSYYIRPTSSTTFNLYVNGNISNVLPTNPVRVFTDNAANINNLDTVVIANVVGISNVNSSTTATAYNPNNTLGNPYWYARQANGSSNTAVDLYRAYTVYQFVSALNDFDQPVVQALIYADVQGVAAGTPVVIASPVSGAPTLNNSVFYIGDVSLIGNSSQSITALDLYYDSNLTQRVLPSTPGTTTAPNTTGSLLGVGIDGTQWGNYVSGGVCLKQLSWIQYNYVQDTGNVFDGTLDGVVYTINQADINNIIARRSGNSLQIQTVSSNAAPINQQLSIAAGAGIDACQQLGLQPYYSGAATQIFGGSYPTFGARFGYNIDVDWSGQTAMIASEYGSAVASTTFDLDTTTFDGKTTRFDDVYAKSGSVDVYQLLPAAARSLENPDKFAWAQQLSDYEIRTGADWGEGISITGNIMAVGSPGYVAGTDSTANDGRIVIYTDRKTAFPTLRTQPDIVDIYSLNEVTVFNSNSRVTLNYLDFIDPLQGRILGAAQQNIDLISAVDPAQYNVGVDIDGVAWGPEQVGYIWWDVTNVRFLEYHTQDINNSAKIWGQTFPGSSIDVYQWIASPVPPAQYVGPGVVLDTTKFCTYTTVTVTNTIVVLYYFWVRGLTQVADNKTLSIESIAQYIANPRSTGIAYMAALAPNTVALYNTNNDIVANTSILNISYDTIPQDNNIHIEYDLIQQDNARQFMDDSSYAKLVDSFAGITADGLPVPDPALGPGSRYGIQFRPRQTMFKDRFLALKNYISFANTVLAAVPIVEEKSFDLLKSKELPPVQGQIDPSTGAPWWNVQVADLTELSFQNIDIVPLNFRYLVDQNSDYNNFWTIYQVVANSAGVRSLELVRLQSYNTNNYWRYVTWYAAGYNPATRPLYTVKNYSDISALTIPDDGVVKVTQNNSVGFELYQNKVIRSYRDDTTGEWIVDTEIVRVALENGTIEILSSVYDYSTEDNKVNPHYPYIETRKIIDSLNTEIYTTDLLIYRNQSMSLMFNYILGEQVDCNWLYKTSLLDVSHPVRKLLPYTTYKPDNQDFVLGYINEVKPYHVLIKDFSLVYATLADVYPGDITDFDVPATFNEANQRYISPILDNSNSYGIYSLANTSPTWTTVLYRNWNSQYGLRIVEIQVIDGGSGYTVTPAVTVSGPTDTPTQARAIIDAQGRVSSIQITIPGGLYRWSADHIKVPNGYNPSIQVVIAPPNNPGVTARAYAVTTPAPVRNFTTTQVFNRMNLRPSFGYWSANISYQQGDLVKFNNAAYRSTIDYNQSSQFDFNYWVPVPAEDLEGVDRTFAYYQGAQNQPGEDALDQLITGLSYPGVVTKRRYLGTWDTSPWSSDPFESDRGRLQAIYNGGTYLDSTLGSLPWSVNVEGGAYIDTYSSHAPEELVPGSTFDTLDLTVNTIPGQDNTNRGFSSPVGAIEYTVDIDDPDQSYSFGSVISYPYAVVLHATDDTGTRIRLYETVDPADPQDYTVDWVSQTITLEPLAITPPPYTLFGGRMLITVYGLGGGNQLLRSSGIRNVVPNGNIIIPIAYSVVNPNLLPVYVNGNALTLGTDYTVSSYFPETPDENDIAPATRINFTANVTSVTNARVDYTVFGVHSTLAQSGYSIPEVQLWTNLTGEVYTATAAGAAGYVAVGLAGEVAYSSDGVTCTRLVPITEEDLISVIYGNGVFLASAADGALYSSGDGQNWQQVSTAPGIAFNKLKFVASRFYGFGAGNQVYVSATGDSWQQLYIDNAATSINSVTSYNSEITALRILSRGNDFPAVPSNVLFANGGNSASGANATVTLTLVGANIQAQGTNYLVGDQIAVTGGVFNTQARLLITRLANTSVGNVAEIAVTVGGDYTQLPSLIAPTTGGNGTGLTLGLDFGLNTITLVSRGVGYTETPQVVMRANSANIGSNYNVSVSRDLQLAAVGAGNAYKFDTSVSNGSWQRVSANVGTNTQLWDIAYNTDDGNLIAVGYDSGNSLSVIDRSLSANAGWGNLTINAVDWDNTSNLTSITAVDTTGGVSTVITTDTTGLILHSANSSSWANTAPEGSILFAGFSYLPSTQLGVVAGNASAIYTTTDGISWTNRSSRELEIENYVGGSNPIDAVVEINGERLRGPQCVSYISDGVSNTYAAGWQRGILNSTIQAQNVSVYVDDQLRADSTYTTQYSQIRDRFEVVFTDPIPAANSRIVIAVATSAVPYRVDATNNRLIVTTSLGTDDVLALTTWRDTREQNFLNIVNVGQAIHPVNPQSAFNTYGGWQGASNVLTLGSQTQGQWSNIGLWYDYAAFGSGINANTILANYNSNSSIVTLDTRNIAVGDLVQGVGIPGSTFVASKTLANITLSQLPLGNGNSTVVYSNSQLSFFTLNATDADNFLSLGNTIVVEDGSGISAKDFVYGLGVPYGTSVTNVKPFVNSLLQTNYAVQLDRDIQSNGYVWNRQFSNSQSNIYGISSGNYFLAVDDLNNIFYSNTGASWNSVDPVALLPLRSIAYGSLGGVGYYVAVGADGSIIRSTDQASWTQEGYTLTVRFNSIAYGAGAFVAVGDAGAIYVSSDAVNWTQAASGVTTNLYNVSYAAGSFVVVGSNAEILSSTNAVTWTKRYLNYVNSTTVTYAGSDYRSTPTVVFGNPYQSTGVTAEAVAVLSGGVASLALLNGGNGYTYAPNLAIVQNANTTITPATAVTQNNGLGTVSYIAITEGGAGYNTAPAISFTSTTPGAGATAVANVSGGAVVGITLTAGGSGYSIIPGDTQVVITAQGGDVPSVVAQANCTVTSSLYITAVTNPGSGYTNYDQGIVLANLQPQASTPQVTITNFMLGMESGPNLVSSGNIMEVTQPANLVLGMQIQANIAGGGFVDLGVINRITGNVVRSNIANIAFTGDITPATQLQFIDRGTGANIQFEYFNNASVANVWVYQRGSGYDVVPNVAISAPYLSGNTATAVCTIAPVTTDNLNAVTLVNNTYVAVGSLSTTIYSADAITWFESNVEPNSSVRLNTVFGYANANVNYIFAAGTDGNLYNTSCVATGWTSLAIPAGNIHQGAVGAGNLVMVADAGQILFASQANTQAWSNATSNTNNDVWGLVYTGSANTGWAAVGSLSTILTTTNVASWTNRTQEWPLLDSASGSYAGGNRYVIVGENGTLFTSTGNGVAGAPTMWTRYDSGTNRNLNAVTYGVNTFVAVGNASTITRSTDGGVTWTASSLGLAESLRGIYYYAPVGFIAVGEGGYVYSSTNGITWSQRASGVTANLNTVVGASIGSTMTVIAAGDNGVISASLTDAFGTRAFQVAGAGSNTQTGANGNSFTVPLTTTSSSRVSVTVDGVPLTPSQFAVTSLYPNVSIVLSNAISSNTLQITTTMPSWRGVTYGAGIFALVGDDGTYWNSRDGLTWLPINPLTSTALRGIAYRAADPALSRANTFVAVGNAAGWQYANSVSGYIATSTTGNLIPLTFAPNFDAISPGMLVTGDYILQNTLVTGKDYAQRLLYVDQTQPNIAPVESRNILLTFTPTVIDNSYTVDNDITNAFRPWVTVNGEYEIINTDWAARGNQVDIIANGFSSQDVIQVLNSSQNSVPDELAFKVWKDMNDNTAVYRQNDFNTTVLTQVLLPEDDEIFVADVTRLQAPNLNDNVLGVCFVGTERVNFRYIDYARNSVSGLLRGVAGTSVQRQEIGALVVDASLLNTIPSAYRDQFTWQDFRGDGDTVTFQCTTLATTLAQQVQVINAGYVVPTRISNQLADGNSNVFVATTEDTANSITGEIYVDRYQQVMVAKSNLLLSLQQQVFLGNNGSNTFVANNISTSNTANIIVAVNNRVLDTEDFTVTLNAGNIPNVVLNFVPGSQQEVKVAVDYLVTDLKPVTVAFAQTPAANTLITISADFYVSSLSPVEVTFAEAPLANTALRIGADRSLSWYNAEGDGIRLQSQPTLAAEFLRGSA